MSEELHITVVSAQQLKDVEVLWIKQDPYCKLIIKDQWACTKSKSGAGCYAVWDETFVLRGEHFLGETLTLQVYDSNALLPDVLIGTADITLQESHLKGQPIHVNLATPTGQQAGVVQLRLEHRICSTPAVAMGIGMQQQPRYGDGAGVRDQQQGVMPPPYMMQHGSMHGARALI